MDVPLNGRVRVIMKSGTALPTALRFVVDNSIKSRHTANTVLKQAGLPKKF